MIEHPLTGDNSSSVVSVGNVENYNAAFRVNLTSGSATVALQHRANSLESWSTYESQSYTATGGEGVILSTGDYRINVSGSSSPTGTATLARVV